MAQTLLLVGGFYHLAFAAFHLLFGRLFRWKSTLRLTTPLNRAVMRVMNLCLVFLFLFLAVASFFGRGLLLSEASGRWVLAFVAGFWLWRAALQAGFFGVRRPLSVLLFVIFLAGGAIDGLPASGCLAPRRGRGFGFNEWIFDQGGNADANRRFGRKNDERLHVLPRGLER
jgi:hypothetical protein